jgi:VCBS repeat-containing protein
VTDAAGNSSSQVIRLTVLSAIPALPDSYTTPEDQLLIVDAQSGLLANDGNDDTGILTVTLLVQPAHGTLQLNEDGSFRYMPSADFSGTDQFAYVATDGVDDTNEASVTVTVAPVNDPPSAG